jgi:hypothetical protein
MQTFNYNGNEVEIYSDIQMPVTTYIDYNRFLLIDSGIGADLESLDAHIGKIAYHIQKGEKDEAITVLTNFRTCYDFMLKNTNPELLSFAALIKSVNGEEWTDRSDEGLSRLVEILGRKGLTMAKVRYFTDKVKKNLILKCRHFFQKIATTRRKKSSTRP